MKAFKINDNEEEFKQFLRDTYGDINICGASCDAADALQSSDPNSYNTKYIDWVNKYGKWECFECGTEHDSEETAEECCCLPEDEEGM